MAESFPRLYLAGGVTTMRTGGNMNGYGDIGIKRDIDAGQKAGPGSTRQRRTSRAPGSVLADARAHRT